MVPLTPLLPYGASTHRPLESIVAYFLLNPVLSDPLVLLTSNYRSLTSLCFRCCSWRASICCSRAYTHAHMCTYTHTHTRAQAVWVCESCVDSKKWESVCKYMKLFSCWTSHLLATGGSVKKQEMAPSSSRSKHSKSSFGKIFVIFWHFSCPDLKSHSFHQLDYTGEKQTFTDDNWSCLLTRTGSPDSSCWFTFCCKQLADAL